MLCTVGYKKWLSGPVNWATQNIFNQLYFYNFQVLQAQL